MKTKIAILFGILILAITAYATFLSAPYDKSKPPGMSLPVAYGHAMTALGSKTNQFHCVGAEVTTLFFKNGAWYFTFYSTNSKVMPKWLAVGFDGEVIFDSGLH